MQTALAHYCRLFIVVATLILLCKEASADQYNKQILNVALQVGDLTLPLGTEVTYSTEGALVEAIVFTPINISENKIPSNTRIIFRSGKPTFLIIPNGAIATINKHSISGAIIKIPSTPISNQPEKWRECPDNGRGWLSPGGGLEFEEMPALVTAGIVEDAIRKEHQLIILTKDYKDDRWTLPAGSILSTSSDGSRIESIYSSESTRIFHYSIPAGTVIEMSGGIVMLNASINFEFGNFMAKANSLVAIAGDGGIQWVTIAKPADVVGITTPEDSFVDYFNFGKNYSLTVIDLSQTTIVNGYQAAAGHSLCISSDGYTNLRLASDAMVGDITFPKDSTLIVDSYGNIIRAVLSKPIHIGDLAFHSPKGLTINFYKNGKVRSGFLATPVPIDGIFLNAGFIHLSEAGGLISGILNGDQIISGIPCLGGKEIYMGEDGTPVRFTLSADWSKGATILHKGDIYRGTFAVTGEVVILDPASLSKALEDIQNKLLDQLGAELLRHSGIMPFGRFDVMNKHSFKASITKSYADLHQELAIPDLLTNPPFADCDSNIGVDVRLRWSISKLGYQPVFVVWIGRFGGFISHNFCPGTDLVIAAGLLFDALGIIHIDLNPDALLKLLAGPIATKEINDSTREKIIALLNSMYPGKKVLDWSFKPIDVYVDKGQLMLSYEYLVEELVQE